MPGVRHRFQEKIILQSNDDNDNDDDDDNDDDAKVHAALPGAKERRAKNDNEHAFSRIHHHHCDSGNLSGMRGVLSHCWNPLKPRVSRAAGVYGDDSSAEMRM